jgi:hypothetical protein
MMRLPASATNPERPRAGHPLASRAPRSPLVASRASLAVLLATTTLALLTGCQSKFTRERFELINVGVDGHEDVRCLLGKPRACFEDEWFYDDLDRHLAARVHFDESGRVSAKE